ncbi:MAG: protease modulator HflC [bacterium]
MNSPRRIVLAVVGVLAIAVIAGCAFTVSEREQVVVTQLRRPIWVISGARTEEERQAIREDIDRLNKDSNLSVRVSFGAGLKFKIPFLQEAVVFDNRLLEYESDPRPITTGDKRTLIVDNFARWRISNPLRFLQRVGTEEGAETPLNQIIYSAIRDELGQRTYQEVIRTSNKILERELEFELSDSVTSIDVGREEIIQNVTKRCAPQLQEYGILIIDVRIQSVELPEENEEKVYGRMQAERQRIAMKFEEEGKAEQAKIMAETDKDVTIKLAEANRQARILEGEGEAEALRIYAQGFTEQDPVTNVERRILGYQTDPDFYEFLRSLEALEKVADEETTFVLTTGNRLFGMLESFE